MKKTQSQRGTSRPRWRKYGEMQAWVIALVAAFLVAVPTIRMSESNEIDTAKERVEEVSLVARSADLKRLSRLVRREQVVVMFPPVQLGHAQQQVLFQPTGHRLPNGLMAPLKC